jgi:ABC-type transporter MlaC component
MKLLKSLILVVAAGLVMTACGGGKSENPSDVVKKVFEAQKNYDFDAVKQYVVKDLIPLIDQQVAALDALSDEEKEQFEESKKLYAQVQYEVGEAVVAEDENSATVSVKVTFMGQENSVDIPLVKEDGVWKVSRLGV